MKKVLVGFSGGVDSISAALYLTNEGYDVTCITFILQDTHAVTAEKAARRAKQLGLKHYFSDRRAVFKERIMDYFAHEYKQGRTPNPCAMCNRHIKFPLLHDESIKNGYEGFSTGHYVRIENGRICSAGDMHKDQSYFISTVNRKYLNGFVNTHNAFLSKQQVREFVEKNGIEIDSSEESQEICFIEGDYADFLINEYGFSTAEGKLIDSEGNILGTHSGYYRFTIGKRKGLNKGFPQRMYVKAINADENTVMLSKEEHAGFSGLRMKVLEKYGAPDADCNVKTRYRQTPLTIKHIECDADMCEIFFAEPSSITQGQICAVYSNSCIVMSGIIMESLTESS